MSSTITLIQRTAATVATPITLPLKGLKSQIQGLLENMRKAETSEELLKDWEEAYLEDIETNSSEICDALADLLDIVLDAYREAPENKDLKSSYDILIEIFENHLPDGETVESFYNTHKEENEHLRGVILEIKSIETMVSGARGRLVDDINRQSREMEHMVQNVQERLRHLYEKRESLTDETKRKIDDLHQQVDKLTKDLEITDNSLAGALGEAAAAHFRLAADVEAHLERARDFARKV